MNSNQPAIEVRPARPRVPQGPRAVDGIDLAVSPGEIYGFLGPNGAGKSTTVLMLTTLLPPTSGRASVGGYDIVRQGSQVRASIGAALQEAALDAILTGREHLKLQATLQGMPKADRLRRTNELLERVGLTEAADRRVGGYSGGMKRRLDLALALVHGPRILFLDEPTTGLDLQSRSALWEEVGAARPRGGHDGVPHDPVPRGGRRAGRPRRDHRSRARSSPRARPTQLKAEIGSPSVEVVPADPSAGGRASPSSSRTSASSRATARGSRHRAAARLARRSSPRSFACSTRPHLKVASLQLHQPSLDDVFLAKTGRKLEGAGEVGDEQ